MPSSWIGRFSTRTVHESGKKRRRRNEHHWRAVPVFVVAASVVAHPVRHGAVAGCGAVDRRRSHRRRSFHIHALLMEPPALVKPPHRQAVRVAGGMILAVLSVAISLLF